MTIVLKLLPLVRGPHRQHERRKIMWIMWPIRIRNVGVWDWPRYRSTAVIIHRSLGSPGVGPWVRINGIIQPPSQVLHCTVLPTMVALRAAAASYLKAQRWMVTGLMATGHRPGVPGPEYLFAGSSRSALPDPRVAPYDFRMPTAGLGRSTVDSFSCRAD
jgi:hypothetical protein